MHYLENTQFEQNIPKFLNLNQTTLPYFKYQVQFYTSLVNLSLSQDRMNNFVGLTFSRSILFKAESIDLTTLDIDPVTC